MTSQEYAFIVTAVLGTLAAVGTVTARNVVHAALYLVVALASVGGHVPLARRRVRRVGAGPDLRGRHRHLLLFGLMLTKAPIGRDSLDGKNRAVGAVISVLLFAGLVWLVQAAFPFSEPVVAPAAGPTLDIGTAMFKDYVLPFEAVSFLLLAALIGAIVLARRDERDPR